jgi:surfactin synthase thioesterase subunit
MNQAETDLWIRRFEPAPDAPVRLACFPHAGGSASFFLPVARALAPRVEVLAVQYPGRQERRHEPCLETIDELVDAVLEPILAWTDRPLALFGHSMGASVAFELACRMEERGSAPLALFVSGRRAPSRDRLERVHELPDADLITEIQSLSGTDSRVLLDEELLRMVLPAVRSDYRAVESYRWRSTGPVQAPLHVHVGTSDPKVTLEEAQAWQRHTTGSFTLTSYSGAHFYLNEHAPRLIETIADQLALANSAPQTAP